MFGMVISYTVKVKLYLGAMGGEVTAELPFVLMHPKVRFEGWSEGAVIAFVIVFVVHRLHFNKYQRFFLAEFADLQKPQPRRLKVLGV